MLTEVYIVLAVVGGMVLVLGLFSGLIKNQSILSDPLIALLVGIVLGPTLLDVLDPAHWGSWETIVEETARVTLAIGAIITPTDPVVASSIVTSTLAKE